MYEELVKRLRLAKAVLSRNKDLIALLSDAAEAIEELSKPKWIPVTERLPQEWWPVLGLIQYHDEKEPPAQQVLWYLGNGHWRETWRGDMIESDVTHWMPLPQPPREG